MGINIANIFVRFLTTPSGAWGLSTVHRIAPGGVLGFMQYRSTNLSFLYAKNSLWPVEVYPCPILQTLKNSRFTKYLQKEQDMLFN